MNTVDKIASYLATYFCIIVPLLYYIGFFSYLEYYAAGNKVSTSVLVELLNHLKFPFRRFYIWYFELHLHQSLQAKKEKLARLSRRQSLIRIIFSLIGVLLTTIITIGRLRSEAISDALIYVAIGIFFMTNFIVLAISWRKIQQTILTLQNKEGS